MDMQTTKGLTRRALLKGAAAGTALAATAATASIALADEPAEAAWDLEVDVAVVGSGAAGHAAALEAAAAGASVAMFEKMDITGGDSMLCDGILGGWGTRLAKECGAEVTADETYEFFMGNSDWYGPRDPAVARIAADKCGETIDWLEGLGVPFEPEVAPRFSYTDLPAIHQVEGKGAQMMITMEEAALAAGVDVRTGTPVVGLIEEEGRIAGLVAAQKDGTQLRVKANGGVVLATGGYGASYDMLVALNPENASIMATSAPGMTGDGLVMAEQAGAHVTRTSFQPMMYMIGSLGTATTLVIDYLFRLHGVLLDANGDRFCNEGMDFLSRNVARATLRQQNAQGSPVVYLIPTSEASPQLTDAEGFDWPSFETAGEAAASLGLDAAHVEEVAARYNGFVEAGVDEDFGRPVEDMVPLAGPFYAVPVMVTTNVTTGGIKIDTEAHALRFKAPQEEGAMLQPLPGLYAAGEVCEWNVAAGWTVCTAATMGRIAGANAAAGK